MNFRIGKDIEKKWLNLLFLTKITDSDDHLSRKESGQNTVNDYCATLKDSGRHF